MRERERERESEREKHRILEVLCMHYRECSYYAWVLRFFYKNMQKAEKNKVQEHHHQVLSKSMNVRTMCAFASQNSAYTAGPTSLHNKRGGYDMHVLGHEIRRHISRNCSSVLQRCDACGHVQPGHLHVHGDCKDMDTPHTHTRLPLESKNKPA